MKRIVNLIIVCSVIFSGCLCKKQDKPSDNSLEIFEKNKEEIKSELKKEWLKGLSKEKIHPDVFSEYESLEKVIEYTVDNRYDDYHKLIKEKPEWKNAYPGNYILVENYTPDKIKECPYYYYINIMYEGGSIHEGIIAALVDSASAGRIGLSATSTDITVRTSRMLPEDAKKLLLSKLSLPASTPCLIKGVRFGSYEWFWGYAIKLNTPVNIKKIYNKDINVQVFYVNSLVYDLDSIPNNTNIENPQEVYEKYLEKTKKEILIGYIDKDVFNSAIHQSLRDFVLADYYELFRNFKNDFSESEAMEKALEAVRQSEARFNEIAPALFPLENCNYEK